MKSKVLTIDARMLFSSGIGTYLQNILKRVRFEDFGLKVQIYVFTQESADWIRQYQPNAAVKFHPYWICGPREQLYWMKNLKGGAFWSPFYDIPWFGYEKLIVTVHDCFPLSHFANFLRKAHGVLQYSVIRHKANAILTVSDFTRHELQTVAKIMRAPIYVIPNGVDPLWFTNERGESPFPFKYLAYVGNLKVHKNLSRLLQAYAMLKPEQKLLCVGPFKNLKERDNRAHHLLQKMSKDVIDTDTVSNEQLRAIVKNADALVLPSLYEGFGMPPTEAMAAKIPVLVSESTSLPEICGNAALYCDPYSVEDIAEGLRKLIEMTREERKRRTEEGSEFVKQYNWDTAAQETMEAFKETLNKD